MNLSPPPGVDLRCLDCGVILPYESPCPGGVPQRCGPCGKAKRKEAARTEADRRRKERISSPEYLEKERERHRRSQRRHSPEFKAQKSARRRASKYGLSPAAFEVLLAQQGGLCAICFCPPPDGTPLHVDHDHETGQIRGLLCRPCNVGLGHFMDSVDRLREAIHYLGRDRP